MCNICDLTENEIQAPCKSRKFDALRQQMYLIIKRKLNIFKTENVIFVDMLTSTDIDVLKAFGFFIYIAAWLLELLDFSRCVCVCVFIVCNMYLSLTLNGYI